MSESTLEKVSELKFKSELIQFANGKLLTINLTNS